MVISNNNFILLYMCRKIGHCVPCK